MSFSAQTLLVGQQDWMQLVKIPAATLPRGKRPSLTWTPGVTPEKQAKK